MLYQVILYGSGQVDGYTEKGQKLLQVCGDFEKVKEMVRLYGLKNTKYLYADLNTGVRKELTESEFLDH